jgi:hypothetical protein
MWIAYLSFLERCPLIPEGTDPAILECIQKVNKVAADRHRPYAVL